ncbi:MAG: putative molybdopterin biosynthesis protein [Kiritimatiellia bacterium]|jgi:putative molybdopterin biosynthesis protein
MNSSNAIVCHVHARRLAAGLSATDLAGRAGISRQALHAIETQRSIPSTAISLRLARALSCQVDDLFVLRGDFDGLVRADGSTGSRVVVGHVGGQWVAHGLDPRSTAPADGAMHQGTFTPFADTHSLRTNALIAGCAPPMGSLAGPLADPRDGRATWLYTPSGAALALLANDTVHVAGMHLTQLTAPEHHDALLRAAMPGVDIEVITLVGWRQGLVVPRHNPRRICSASDLAQPDLRVARRQPGSGAAIVLERALASVGAPAAQGPILRSHLEAAHAVSLGAVDVAVAIEPLADAFDLHFVPLSEERFELAVRAHNLSHPGVARLLDRLTSARYALDVAGMGAYDLGLIGDRRRLSAA